MCLTQSSSGNIACTATRTRAGGQDNSGTPVVSPALPSEIRALCAVFANPERWWCLDLIGSRRARRCARARPGNGKNTYNLTIVVVTSRSRSLHVPSRHVTSRHVTSRHATSRHVRRLPVVTSMLNELGPLRPRARPRACWGREQLVLAGLLARERGARDCRDSALRREHSCALLARVSALGHAAAAACRAAPAPTASWATRRRP
jgi:hypothetical protein